MASFVSGGGGDVNIIETVKVNNTALTVSNKAVNVDLTNYATKSDIAAVYKPKGTKTNYSDLPASGNEVGDVWNITNADATHGIKAGDNVVYTSDGTWDNLSGNVDLSGYLPKSGGTMTGKITLDGAPTADLHASTKKYVDDGLAGKAASSHSHGNITSDGDITATAPTIASGDQIIINDHSASKITNGPTFDGSTATKALTQKGTWESFTNNAGTVTQVTAGTGLSIGSTAGGNFTTSGTINHTNSVTAKTAAAQSAKTLAFGGTFTLYEEKYDAQGHITGVASYNMTMPANPNTDVKVTQTATSTNANYEILFSETADNTTRTEGARKYSNLTFNPSTGTLKTTVAQVNSWNLSQNGSGSLTFKYTG